MWVGACGRLVLVSVVCQPYLYACIDLCIVCICVHKRRRGITQPHLYMHTVWHYTHVHTSMDTLPYIHVCTQACTYMHTHAYTRTCIPLHIHIHTHTSTYIHIYKCTHTQMHPLAREEIQLIHAEASYQFAGLQLKQALETGQPSCHAGFVDISTLDIRQLRTALDLSLPVVNQRKARSDSSEWTESQRELETLVLSAQFLLDLRRALMVGNWERVEDEVKIGREMERKGTARSREAREGERGCGREGERE